MPNICWGRHTNPPLLLSPDEHPAAIHHKNGTSASSSLHAYQGSLPAASFLLSLSLSLTLLFILSSCNGGEVLDGRVSAVACCLPSLTTCHERTPDDRDDEESKRIRLLSH